MTDSEQDSPGHSTASCTDVLSISSQAEELSPSSQDDVVILLRQELKEINFDYSTQHKIFHCLECQTCFEPDAIIRHAIIRPHKIEIDKKLKANISRLISEVPCLLAAAVVPSIQSLNVIPFLKLQEGSNCGICQKSFRGNFQLKYLRNHLREEHQHEVVKDGDTYLQSFQEGSNLSQMMY